MKKKIIVTGCSGFLGSDLCPRLAENYTVIGIDITPPEYEHKNFNFQEIDLRVASQIDDFFANFTGKCHGLINLAAYYDFWNLPSDNYSGLLDSLPNLFKGFDFSGVPKVII